MRHETDGDQQLERLTHAVGNGSAARDADGAFPVEAFETLRASGVLAEPPIGAAQCGALLRLLAAVGRGDLSVGRIFEGHVNACYLIDRFGTDVQKSRFTDVASGGGVFGVWNTDAPDDPLRLEGTTLVGKKNFASGVDGLSYAIVTVTSEAGRQMIVVPVGELPVDRTWWRPVGMKASGSHIADMTGLNTSADWLLGQPDDYIAQPWFSAGAIRFVAVQVGGMHAVFDIAVNHLVSSKRFANPYQAHRLARMGVKVESGYLWLDRLATAWSSAAANPQAAGLQDYLAAAANAGRMIVEAAAMEVLHDAEQAIGAAGMIAPHPFERVMRDLRTYLRQPNPDGAAAAFGEAIARQEWAPSMPGKTIAWSSR